ncbi:sensor histidine kinase [Paenibacillus xylanexedens]|uniref:sensor histidine kinase n=1 Tax=Paenibacillus xylanexedens TaxID=528191 RepID=UPI0016435FCC|nr:sensor histidine kinase [Paenibacillus xylanexedens]
MPIRALQYGLILVPALLYILVLPQEQDGIYTFHILIAIGIAVGKDFTRADLPRLLLLIIEILWNCWLITQYGPFMLFLSISMLYVYIYRLDGVPRWLILGAQLIASNIALHKHYTTSTGSSPLLFSFQTNADSPLSPETTGWVIGNLLLVTVAVISWQGSRTASSRGQLEQVYDELRNKHYELQDARAQMVQFTKQLEDAAQAEERTRISRQLHDDIGHRLIRTKMMSEAALLTLPVDSEQGTEMVKQIRDQLAASMDDMRTTLHKLKPESYQADTYALDRLLEEVGRETGVKTSYRELGNAHVLYPSIQIVLYKNAKEAVTNALRHGNAKSIRVELQFRENEIQLTVSNDGQTNVESISGVSTVFTAEADKHNTGHSTSQSTQTQSTQAATLAGLGMGHESMRLRTQLVGGELQIQSTYPYTVITRLPLPRQADMI